MVTGVKVLDGYCLELTCSDGVQGKVDLRNRIIGRGGAFKLLQDAAFFRKVKVDSNLGTIVWPNEADFCPDFLYSWATGTPVPLPDAE